MLPFSEALLVRARIVDVLSQLKQVCRQLRTVHGDLVKECKEPSWSLGVDAFHFQTRLVEQDMEHLASLMAAVDRRAYNELWQLRQMLPHADQAAKELVSPKVLGGTPHINPDLLGAVRDSVMEALDELKARAAEAQRELETEEGRAEQGLNVDSIVCARRCAHEGLKGRCCSAKRYMSVFEKHSTAHYRSVLVKANLALDLLQTDVHVGGAGSLRPATELDVGRRVVVDRIDSPGTLRFYGPVDVCGIPQIRCGIELDAAEGRNDGTAYGQFLFRCKPKHGITKRPTAVWVVEPLSAEN